MNNSCYATPQNTVPLDARVQDVVNAIRTGSIIPYGDYGGPTVYYFSLLDTALGNLVYTVFDKQTDLGLASFTVRYGAAATIRQIIFSQFPRSQIDLQYLILPNIPISVPPQGTVIP